MMERVYAFTDEYGAFGWNLDKPNVSSHFIITAIIVKESDLEEYERGSENIRKKHFQTGEIKSSKVGKNHKRRLNIISELKKLPFNIFSVCIDKKKCVENMNLIGLKFKGTFYKFMNNIVHKELKNAFKKITIVSDEFGRNEYMKSFCRYVDAKKDVPNLLGDVDFSFANSRQDVRVQVADFISGTLAFVFDTAKKTDNNPNYLNILKDKIIRIELYPKTYDNYTLENSVIAEDYDVNIASLCFAQAVNFIETHKDEIDDEVEAQIIVLKYMLFRFMNNDMRGYIYTEELRNQLKYTNLSNISTAAFRMKIIGKLRDRGVIIASSSKGYKIPSNQAELYDYINHDASIVIPMLSRLKKCRDLIKLSTVNELDILDHVEYKNLKHYYDNFPSSNEKS